MIVKLLEAYKKWYQSKLEEYLRPKYGYQVNETEEESKKVYAYTINCQYHEDYYYTKGANADTTVINLGGTIQQKVNQRPFQIICEVEDRYRDDLLDAMDDLAYDNNEEIIELEADKNGVKRKYRAYFNAPAYTQKFVDYGATKRAILTMDASVILFQNILNIKELKLGFASTSLEEVKFNSVAVSYMVDPSMTGGVNSTKSLAVGNTASNNIVVSAICKNTAFFKGVISAAMACTDPDKQVYAQIKFRDDTTYKLRFIIQACSYAEEVQTFPNMQLTLARSGEW